MKINRNDPPRVFEVGLSEIIQMKDCAHIELEPDEQVTLLTPSGAEYDVSRKAWGFYATPSLNGRLPQFGLKTALVKNRIGRYFILLVEKGHEEDFARYVEVEKLAICAWLDDAEVLGRIEKALHES